ncbi:MAG: hypothetical protein PVI66_18140, partial [Candidatus Aminicenantes bacterium]
EGERIRMEIASSSFPEYSRNLNTGGHSEMGAEYVSAVQRIYHTAEYPSHLLLPVIKTEIFDSQSESPGEDEAQESTSLYASFIGKYTHPKLGEIKVLEQRGKLALDIPKKMVLAFDDPDDKGTWVCQLSNQITLRFSKDDTGDVDGLSLFIQTRLPKKSETETVGPDVPKNLEPYLGKYPIPMEGAELTVIFKDENLAVVDSEGEVVALKGPDQKGLWIYKSSEYKISFVLGDSGEVKAMIVHQTLEAPKSKTTPPKNKDHQEKESYK